MSVVAHMTMSLDGFIATEEDQVGSLFDWYDAGPLEVPSGNPRIQFHLDQAGATMMRALMDQIGAVVCGRRLFDITRGWGDRHPLGSPVVVVTHSPPDDAHLWPRTTFASTVDQAISIATEVADGRDVAVASADIVGQALDLKLVDEIAVSLVPMLMTSGKAYFGSLTSSPVMLDDPSVVPGMRATHLRYRVRKDSP